jgi:hypothetical protein
MTRDLFENSIMYLNGPPGTAALWSRIGRKRTLRGQGKINAVGLERSLGSRERSWTLRSSTPRARSSSAFDCHHGAHRASPDPSAARGSAWAGLTVFVTPGGPTIRIFLAGASGAIGRRLTPLLIAAGHEVTGTTRSVDKVQELAAGGVDAVVVDVFNAGAVRDAVVRARPEIVIHQLTDLPQVLDPALLRDALSRNSRLRIEGTANLVAAAQAAGARRGTAAHPR